jgi:hypothetical protein
MISGRNDIPKLLKKYNCTIGVELGVSEGRYSKHLLKNHNFDAFYSIDSWNSRSHGIEEYIAAYTSLKKYDNTHIYRATFEEILPIFPDEYFDFIYIDGYAHLGNESTIEQWYTKLKPGGIYSGHDYDKKYSLTKKNIDKLCCTYNLKLNTTEVRPKVVDRYASWWVIK